MWMPTIRRVLLPLLCLIGSIALAAAPDETISRPQVRVGDAWMYRQTSLITQKAGKFSYRVTEVTADRIKLASEGYTESYTPDWNLLESSAGIKVSPHEGYFDFPLEPGKIYPFKSERTVAKSRNTWEGTVTVQGWETIEVPAGIYRALRVDVSGSFGNGPVSRRAELQQSYWWSAEVRRWVRYDLWMSKPASKTTDFHTRTELIRFTPAP
jgi:hypothetical protein